jgi:transposase
MRRRSVEDEAVPRLLKIPGIGPITATALAATVPDAREADEGYRRALELNPIPP